MVTKFVTTVSGAVILWAVIAISFITIAEHKEGSIDFFYRE